MNIVISQPMYFPWVGLLEQFKLADVFVFYDDVQFEKGGLFNRVQAKTLTGSKWLTVPLSGRQLDQNINQVMIDTTQDWRRSQLSLLMQAYSRAPFKSDMIEMVNGVFAQDYARLAALAEGSMLTLADYFGLTPGKKLFRSSELGIGGASSQRVLDICKYFGADRYITGHGAAKYLDHQLFDAAGIEVCYMTYEKRPYPQLHSDFAPFVSGLDLAANCGPAGAKFICSGFQPWQVYFAQNDRKLSR